MSALFDDSRFLGFPTYSYEALDAVQKFMELNGVDLGEVFEVLLNSGDGYLIYVFGEVEIQFSRGFGVPSARANAISMTLEYHGEKRRQFKAYEYELKDLRFVKRKKELQFYRQSR
jgi:hypothetical protein